jgi:ribonuclease BN (tRNA processing enzyme)
MRQFEHLKRRQRKHKIQARRNACAKILYRVRNITGDVTEGMKIRVLGCYETTSFLLDESLLLDAGCITNVLKIEEQDKVKHILLTHSHLDHVRDIPMLIDNTMEGRSDPINLIGTEKTLAQIRSHLFNDCLWPDLTRIGGKSLSFLRFKPIKPDRNFILDDLTIRAVEVSHIVETVGYFIKGNDASILYIGDTGPTDKIWEEANKFQGLKAIFIETAFPDRLADFASNSGHLTPLTLKSELQKLENPNIPIFVFHLKPRYSEAIRKEIQEIGNPNITILRLGDKFEF